MDNCQLEDLLDEHSRTLSRAGPKAGKMTRSIRYSHGAGPVSNACPRDSHPYRAD